MENYNKLDVAAKLFPTVSNKGNTSVFRVCVILNEEIDPLTLQLAVNMIYERFSFLFLRLRRGFFWHYLDTNYMHFRIEEDRNSPCENILSYESKGHIIKVLYYKNRISVEAFHSIADASGILEFLKALVYYYICIKHGQINSEGKVLLFDQTDKIDEDSFKKYFDNFKVDTKRKQKKDVNSFIIKGEKYKKRGHSVVTATMSVSKLKESCKKKNCSITALLIAIMINAIYEQKQKSTNSHKPIVIAVPVNLRRIFTSRTLKNFFGVINVGFTMSETVTFDTLLNSVKEQLTSLTEQEELEHLTGGNVSLGKNLLLMYTPLFLKNIVVPVGFNLLAESKKTTAISNIGPIDFPSGMKPFIKHTELLLYPTTKSPLNCGVCSYEDTLTISFTRNIKDNSIIRQLFTHLSQIANIDISVYSNNWGEEDEKM